ncbi:hypothetical protein GC173_07450 [bacterium]|nr:hypothetical protein [bacterium]
MIYIYTLAVLFALLLSSSFEGPMVFVANLVIGLVIAWVVARKLPLVPGQSPARSTGSSSGAGAGKFIRNLTLFLYDFVKDLVLSNIAVAKDVWAPRGAYRPLIVEVPTADLTPFETMVIANRITLTPGTLTADVADDHSFIVVHAMYDGGPEQPAGLRRPIDMLKEGFTAK